MKKTFDAVAFMRRRREELSREYEGLSWDEQECKIREALKDDPLYQRLKHRVVQPRTLRYAAVHERRDQDYDKPHD